MLTFLMSLSAVFSVTALVMYLLVSKSKEQKIKALELNTLGVTNTLATKEVELEKLQKNFEAVLNEKNNYQEKCFILTAEKKAIEATLIEREKNFEEKMALLNEASQKLADTFSTLSAEALKNNANSFLTLAKQSFENLKSGAHQDLEARKLAVENLVKPLQESLSKMNEKMEVIEKNRITSESQLGNQLKGLADLQGKLQQETGNLVKALRAPQVRGRWGEIQLKRVVELAGMVEYCDFTTQESVNTESGKQRPDMIIKLPSGKNIVVDAKATCLAYIEALETPDEESRSQKLKDHARQVKDQLIKLASKSYWEQFNPAPEFVVLFLPAESFFSAALEQDKTLIEFGANSKVLLATPTTLIALLRAVAYGWKQESLTQNAKEISEIGKTLYDRLITGTGHVDDLRRNLERVIQSFNKFVGNYEGRVLSAARKFQGLGIGSDVEIQTLEVIDETPRTLQLVTGDKVSSS